MYARGYSAERGGARAGVLRPHDNLTDSVRHFYAGVASLSMGDFGGTQHGHTATGRQFGGAFGVASGAGRIDAASIPVFPSAAASFGAGCGNAVQGERRSGILVPAGGGGCADRNCGAGVFAESDQLPMIFTERTFVMSAQRDATVHGRGPKAFGIDEVLRDSHRYAEELRQRDRMDQRRGWLWFSLLVVTVGTIVGFWAWISQ